MPSRTYGLPTGASVPRKIETMESGRERSGVPEASRAGDRPSMRGYAGPYCDSAIERDGAYDVTTRLAPGVGQPDRPDVSK